MSAHMSVYMSGHMSVYMSAHISVYISVRMSVRMSVHTSVHMSVHMHMHMSVHMSAHLSVHLSAHMYAHMSAHTCMQMRTIHPCTLARTTDNGCGISCHRTCSRTQTSIFSPIHMCMPMVIDVCMDRSIGKVGRQYVGTMHTDVCIHVCTRGAVWMFIEKLGVKVGGQVQPSNGRISQTPTHKRTHAQTHDRSCTTSARTQVHHKRTHAIRHKGGAAGCGLALSVGSSRMCRPFSGLNGHESSQRM